LEQIERWLTWAGHFKLLFVKTGLGGLILTGLAGIWIGALAWWHQAPAYQVVLAFMFGMGAALFLANQSLKLITAWKIPASITRQQARRLDRVNPGGIRLGGNTALVITLLACALIIVGGLDITHRYDTWRSDIEQTYLLVIPRSVTAKSDRNPPFAVDLYNKAVGPIKLSSTLHDHDFQYPPKILSKEDEDYYSRRLHAGLTDPVERDSVVFPHAPAGFYNYRRPEVTKEQWNDFLNEKIIIYAFVEWKYLAGGYVKITEACMFYQKTDFPSAHQCIGHNNWRWEEDANATK
jgi:hypothetical protein